MLIIEEAESPRAPVEHRFLVRVERSYSTLEAGDMVACGTCGREALKEDGEVPSGWVRGSARRFGPLGSVQRRIAICPPCQK